jgi:hypothetical protein
MRPTLALGFDSCWRDAVVGSLCKGSTTSSQACWFHEPARDGSHQVPAAAMKRYATTLTKDPARDAACGQELRTIRAIVMENCACSHSQRLTNRTCKPRLHSGQGALLRCSQAV